MHGVGRQQEQDAVPAHRLVRADPAPEERRLTITRPRRLAAGPPPAASSRRPTLDSPGAHGHILIAGGPPEVHPAPLRRIKSRTMASEEELQQAWINTRFAVLQAIDAQLDDGKVNGDGASLTLDLAEAYAWLTRPDQAHGKGA